ncbi:hypothetical protein F5Y00DRAFT_260540 [Daldinia vernicosa]|uniref:uncharacterized protein n=1 Tax=Daldinia vernicosa TaxID=114800 RepID=UPI0020086CE0|nr:uncharacterized protein F5Y00DRAFT_260540 [Daldinia vernicosa]KAI0850244.1 hypothetical protein F5Y00DRAFT_260540 [Daldinia vernicosa]
MAASMGSGAQSRLITSPLVLALWLLLFANAAEAKKTTPAITPAPSSRPTAVPIWLPDVSGEEWSRWRGSIISSNDVETVYTVFCPPERPGCIVAAGNDMPFTFTEGPGTLRTAYTIAGTLSITSACILASTTAATCSGSTWVAAAGLTQQQSLGPMTLSLSLSNATAPPYTLSGTDVSWGVLMLGDAPLTSTRGGRTYTYYTTTTSSESTPAPTTTGNGPAAAATTGTKTAGGGVGGGGGGGNAAATGKGKPKKSGARMVVGGEGVWKGGVVLVGLVAVLLW